MGTRAVYTFIDADNRFSVYKHYDGYPEERGAYRFIEKAEQYAWELPRFAADDFACAFIRANKDEGGGGVYMSKGHRYHGDLSYYYTIKQVGDKLEVKCKNAWDLKEKIPTVYL